MKERLTVEDHKGMAKEIIDFLKSDLFVKIEGTYPKTSLVAKKANSLKEKIEELRNILDDEVFKGVKDELRTDGKWDSKKMNQYCNIYYPGE